MYRRASLNCQMSQKTILPTLSSTSANPVRRKLRSLAHSAKTHTTSPATAQAPVSFQPDIFRYSNTTESDTGMKNIGCSGYSANTRNQRGTLAKGGFFLTWKANGTAQARSAIAQTAPLKLEEKASLR